MIIYVAAWLSERSDRLSNVSYGLIPLAIVLGVVCGLVMLEPDRGTTMVIFLIATAIYFVAGANIRHILGATGLSITAFLLLVHLAQQNARIAAFHDPWKYYSSYGYQPIHALYALGSGGIFGTGLGQGRQKFQWLPQAHTDAIYAIIGEELGMIGTVVVLAAFALIAYRGYRIAAQSPDPFAALVAVGITSWIFLQGMINIAVTTSLIPFTGITLPFLSYGGTSLISCMAGIGILLNISRHTVQEKPHGATPTDKRNRSPALAAFLRNTGSRTLLSHWGGNRRSRLPRSGSRRSVGKRSRS
jgi:cell division protein FtsW